jgi:hypothetical protein
MTLKEPPTDVAYVHVLAHVKCGGDPARLMVAPLFAVLLDAGEVLRFGQGDRLAFPPRAGLQRD